MNRVFLSIPILLISIIWIRSHWHETHLEFNLSDTETVYISSVLGEFWFYFEWGPVFYSRKGSYNFGFTDNRIADIPRERIEKMKETYTIPPTTLSTLKGRFDPRMDFAAGVIDLTVPIWLVASGLFAPLSYQTIRKLKSPTT